jgi:hypothetical protein
MRRKMHHLNTIVRALEDDAATKPGGWSADGPPAATATRDELVIRLRQALNEVRILSGMLHICAACKKIHDDDGSWQQCEVYIRNHSEADFSHGLCPTCAADVFAEAGVGAPEHACD